jgi:hypothetical protein
MTVDLARPTRSDVSVDVDEVAAWDDAHRYTPAPRHRRRLLLKAMSRLEFADVLDAGCAQPFLLAEAVARFGVPGFGCDVSPRVVAANRRDLPGCEFVTLDLTRSVWPGGRTFDLVVCSEVLEHLAEWRAGLANVVAMSRRHVLITVPGGPIRAMDRRVGHVQHFEGGELLEALRGLGCRVVWARSWGWPFHSAYKAAISAVAPEGLYRSFSGGRPYGPVKRAASEALHLLFFLNDLAWRGRQWIVLASAPGSRP